MNYINRPKECYTQEEWIKYLEESIRELRKDKENLNKEKGIQKARFLEEIKRLKSREEKLMAYYEWFVDKDNDLATVEDIVNKNIELEEENRKLKSERDKWRGKYNRLKSEFNLLKNKIWTTQK